MVASEALPASQAFRCKHVMLCMFPLQVLESLHGTFREGVKVEWEELVELTRVRESGCRELSVA